MTIWSISLKDLRLLIKDRGLLIQLFLLPLVFIIGFSAVFSAAGGESKIALTVVNLDPGGEVAASLITGLEVAGMQVDLTARDDAQAMLEGGELDRALTIPAGFSAEVQAGRPTTLLLVNSSDASEEGTAAIVAGIEGIASSLSLQTQLITAFRQMDAMMALAPEEYQVFGKHVVEDQARSQFQRSLAEPLVSVSQGFPVSLMGGRDELGLETTVPGFIVLFVFLTAQATAQSIHDEKKMGSFRRLVAAPISKLELLVGKMVPNFVIAVIQIAVIFAVSSLLLPVLGLGELSLGQDPLALVLVSLAMALCSTALGVLIAALAQTDSQVSAISQVALWVMGAVGGAFMPRFLMGDFLGAVGRILPQSWANDAFYDLMLRGLGVTDVATEILALLGFTAVFALIGLWRFDYE